MTVSVDRSLAVHLHLRYQELVTHKRVVAAVISVWVFSAFISLIMLWDPRRVQALITGYFICCLLTTMFYTVEPRFNEVAGDRPNLFDNWRVRYIENLDITNLRGNNQNVRYIEVIVND